MPWSVLTLELDPASVEAFSDALLEAGAESAWIDNATAGMVTALFRRDEDARAAADDASRLAGVALPPYRIARIGDEDWVRLSQAQFPPLAVGRLWIVPSWHVPPAQAQVVVRLDPGRAFGTGSHPTTRLALGFLDRHVTGGERVLDYGCGSGILAIAAAKLGAGRVDAVDTDPDAVAQARANAKANNVELSPSSPDALVPGLYDIVVANILAQPLIVLAPVLAARLAPRGRLGLSGILASQAREVAEAYDRAVELRTGAAEGEWVLLEGARR